MFASSFGFVLAPDPMMIWNHERHAQFGLGVLLSLMQRNHIDKVQQTCPSQLQTLNNLSLVLIQRIVFHGI
jgi:hypothetical protein